MLEHTPHVYVSANCSEFTSRVASGVFLHGLEHIVRAVLSVCVRVVRVGLRMREGVFMCACVSCGGFMNPSNRTRPLVFHIGRCVTHRFLSRSHPFALSSSSSSSSSSLPTQIATATLGA